MNPKKQYLRTDMAEECCADLDLEKGVRGIRFREYENQGITITQLDIASEEGETIIGKPQGCYVTLNVGKIWLAEDSAFEQAAQILAQELLRLTKNTVSELSSILVVGLGNRFITSDAIGPLAVKHMTVTRHIQELDPSLFHALATLPLAAIAPGVIGQTGIETAELVRSAAACIAPSVILCIDALAARSVDRLAVTVQLSDTGIAPGSGIGNRRQAINRETLGIPVIAIGVPTVVDSSTLVYDMLEKAGITDIDHTLKSELENGRSFFVTLKDADTASAEMARLLARAIHLAFSIES